jgi:hypothetical protein
VLTRKIDAEVSSIKRIHKLGDVSCLIFHWAYIAQVRMSSSPIIVNFNVLEHKKKRDREQETENKDREQDSHDL